MSLQPTKFDVCAHSGSVCVFRVVATYVRSSENFDFKLRVDARWGFPHYFGLGFFLGGGALYDYEGQPPVKGQVAAAWDEGLALPHTHTASAAHERGR